MNVGGHVIDSTTDYAHAYLGIGRKTRAYRRVIGRSRGEFASRRHCPADTNGRPIAFYLVVRKAANYKAYETLTALPERLAKALLSGQCILHWGPVRWNIQAFSPRR